MLSPFQRLATAFGLFVALATVSVGLHFAFHHRAKPAQHANQDATASTSHDDAPKILRPPEYFRNLPNPDLVLMLSGQMYGYLQPCGCSRPQLGGLERRYELLKRLEGRGWIVSAADLGDLAPKQIDEQGRIKYETALQVYKELGTAALGMGLTEFAMPLDQALGYAQNYQPPFVLAANFDGQDQFPEMYRGWTVHNAQPEKKSAVVQASGSQASASAEPPVALASVAPDRPKPSRVAYIGLIADSVAKKAKERDPNLKFRPIDAVLPGVLKEVQAKNAELLVLLFQGSKEETVALLGKYPQFHVVVRRDDIEEPSALPERVGDTLVINTGHKGRYVGLVAVYPPNATVSDASQKRRAVDSQTLLRSVANGRSRYDLRYQLVDLGEFYELPDDKTNPARERMKDYVLRVHQENFLTKYPKRSHKMQLDFPEAKFVGASACKECHPKTYAKWASTKHSHAYENLAKYGRPIAKDNIGRQYDPECIKCHTTGFEHKTGFVDEKTTAHLLGNQCENCHGPASLHVAKPRDPKYAFPLRLSISTVENLCRSCHDQDNDPKFDLAKYWEEIKHGRE